MYIMSVDRLFSVYSCRIGSFGGRFTCLRTWRLRSTPQSPDRIFNLEGGERYGLEGRGRCLQIAACPEFYGSAGAGAKKTSATVAHILTGALLRCVVLAVSRFWQSLPSVRAISTFLKGLVI